MGLAATDQDDVPCYFNRCAKHRSRGPYMIPTTPSNMPPIFGWDIPIHVINLVSKSGRHSNNNIGWTALINLASSRCNWWLHWCLGWCVEPGMWPFFGGVNLCTSWILFHVKSWHFIRFPPWYPSGILPALEASQIMVHAPFAAIWREI